MEAAAWAVAGLLAAALVAAVVGCTWLWVRDRARSAELRRLAGVLDQRGVVPEARARVAGSDAAVADLAAAVNRRLDYELEQEAARAAADERFHEGLAALSHDLRTPLAGAQGYLQLAEREDDPMRRQRFYAGATERLGALRELVDDLFAYARVSRGSWEPELAPLELAPVVAEVLAAHYGELVERGWEPEVDLGEGGADGGGAAEPTAILANAEAVARIAENLVANALAHGSGNLAVRVADGGQTLTVSNAVDAHAAARLDVARVFEDFYQADSARAGHGSGLGLATVARLAAGMGAAASADLLAGPVFCVTVRFRSTGEKP